LNVASTAGATLLLFGFVIIAIYLALAFRFGGKPGPNPWGSRGFEWITASPPITENFPGEVEVTGTPYDYQVDAPSIHIVPEEVARGS
jgi:cytochrome c oxidase subunit 1